MVIECKIVCYYVRVRSLWRCLFIATPCFKKSWEPAGSGSSEALYGSLVIDLAQRFKRDYCRDYSPEARRPGGPAPWMHSNDNKIKHRTYTVIVLTGFSCVVPYRCGSSASCWTSITLHEGACIWVRWADSSWQKIWSDGPLHYYWTHALGFHFTWSCTVRNWTSRQRLDYWAMDTREIIACSLSLDIVIVFEMLCVTLATILDTLRKLTIIHSLDRTQIPMQLTLALSVKLMKCKTKRRNDNEMRWKWIKYELSRFIVPIKF